MVGTQTGARTAKGRALAAARKVPLHGCRTAGGKGLSSWIASVKTMARLVRTDALPDPKPDPKL